MASEAISTIEKKEPPSTLTTADNSIAEKILIPEALATKLDNEPEAPGSGVEDETQYPAMITRIAVGIGLALTFFLVLPLTVYTSDD